MLSSDTGTSLQNGFLGQAVLLGGCAPAQKPAKSHVKPHVPHMLLATDSYGHSACRWAYTCPCMTTC